MDFSVAHIAVYLAAAFAAAVIAGISGFAFALIAAAVWLHILHPAQVAILIACYGLIVQGYGAWKMRHAASWSRIWPFLVGGAPGVIAGALALRLANPAHVRVGVGAFLVLYSLYSLLRPAMPPVRAGTAADTGVGFLSGVLGAMTGFAGILIVLWSGLRGWSPDVQRGVFQPASVAMLLMCGLALGFTGSISRATVELFLVGLPALALGTWAGFALYGKLDPAGFRRVMLVLLLLSGLPLIARPLLGG